VSGASFLDPAGPQAALLAGLWRPFFWIGVAVWIAVALFLAAALVARRREADGRDRGLAGWVGAATGATTLVLLVLVGLSVSASRALPGDAPAPLQIEVTGHQWWWNVKYPGPTPHDVFQLGNEIHVPTGERVDVKLQSRDVIHSFWAANLHGKMDLIPGKTNHLVFQADRAGVYPGRCAEYCGLQHAHMGFVVVAEPRAAFEAWEARQRTPARAPSTAEEERGRAVFLATTCATCHALNGETAYGTIGPDLTHVGSRLTLGAATLPNAAPELAAWIADAHASKPGVAMPPAPVVNDDLRAVAAYLRSLQ
jgi:cytochrome c oxidase subunit 2